MANVSMTVPTDYSADQQSIDRRRKLAEAMQAQSAQPIESQTAGGWVIPTSPWQGMAKLAQAFAGAYGQHKADESERTLASKYRQDLIDTVTNAERARLGTPGSPQPSADLGGGPAQPASPANAQLANAMLLNHPATQPLGLQGMQQDMLNQSFVQAGQGGQATPATPGAPQATQVASIAPNGSVPIGQPPAQPQAPAGANTGFGGPAGGVPMATWLAADPQNGRTKYLEQLAKDHAEAQKPVIDRGYGIKVWNPATKKYELASNPADITAVERAKLEATQPYETPITLKTSSGQDIQISRPEYAEYQKSGKLPERYGKEKVPSQGAPLPKNVPEQDRAAYEAVASGKVPAAYGPTPGAVKSGLGTVGATQTQADTLQQAGQQRASVEMGEGLGKRYNSIQDAGFSANQKMQKFDRLGGLLSSIDTGKLTPTGTELAAWAKSAGFQISDKVDNAQAAKAMSNEMALELRNPSGGAGMPGAMSDSDRNYLQSLIASIDKTPGANQLLLEGMQKLALRDRDVAQLARDYKKSNGGQFDDGFYDELSKFSDAHPLFKPQSPQPPAGGFTEGQTATGPGGQKVTYRNGQWVPNGR